MIIKRIVFWQNIVSPHQMPYIRKLPELSGGKEIILVAAEPMSRDRISLGWEQPDTGTVKVLINPDDAVIENLLSNNPPESLHLINGISDALPFVKCVLSARSKYSFKCGAIAEGADFRGFRGWLRNKLYRFLAQRVHQKLDFLCAMGKQGEQWYKDTSWPLQKIYPFAYITEQAENLPLLSNTRDGIVRIVFIGQLIHRKGIDILLHSLRDISSSSKWHLDIIGNGHEEFRLKKLVTYCELEHNVTFRGRLQHPEIALCLQKADFLVVPSRFDGWGAVINEALAVGTPVICSDACGAKDLLKDSWRGEVLKTNHTASWKRGLKKWINKGRLTPADRQRVINWSACITGISISRYFLAVLENVYGKALRPPPPWDNSF